MNNFLTLKNSPVLNKYNFKYNNNKLTLVQDSKELITISSDNINERLLLSKKITELETSLIKPILTRELNQIANRPLKSGLKTDFAQKNLNLEPPTVEECLDSIKKQM